MKALAILEQHHGYVIWGCVLAVMAMLWLCYVCCYGCCTSQERINASAVPTAPHIFFQPLNLHLGLPWVQGTVCTVRYSKQLALWARSAREGPWQPTPVFSTPVWKIPIDREVWWATVHRVTKNQTWLKQLSMHTLPYYDLIFYYICKDSISKKGHFLGFQAEMNLGRTLLNPA